VALDNVEVADDVVDTDVALDDVEVADDVVVVEFVEADVLVNADDDVEESVVSDVATVRALVLLLVVCTVVVVDAHSFGSPGKHCEYQASENTQPLPLSQHVAPCQFCPPHCPQTAEHGPTHPLCWELDEN